MPGPEIITRIMIDTIDSVIREEKAIFVACIRDDIDYQETRAEIEFIALFAGPDLKVCFALEDILPYFEKRFFVSGTPSFPHHQERRAPGFHPGQNLCPGTDGFHQAAYAGPFQTGCPWSAQPRGRNTGCKKTRNHMKGSIHNIQTIMVHPHSLPSFPAREEGNFFSERQQNETGGNRRRSRSIPTIKK